MPMHVADVCAASRASPNSTNSPNTCVVLPRRPDVLAARNLTVPNTWQEVLETARILNG